MSLENTLERIAVALERLQRQLPEPQPPDDPAPVSPPAAATAVPASPVRGRGRPAKSAGEAPAPVAPATPAAPEVDPFAMDEPTPVPEKVTLKDVQAALVAYQKRVNSPEKARALLKEVGGVDVLPKLPEAKWGAVVNAANAG